MAASLKHLSFLTLIFLVSSLQIQARESEFFSKEMRYNTRKEAQPVQTQALSPTQQEDPSNYNQLNQNGYGIYGHASNEPSTTTTTTTNNNVEYNARDVPSKFTTEEGAYTTEKNYENKQPTTTTTSSYPKSEYGDKKFGMSDTRFLDNGRYFYNVNGNNYRNRYEPGKGSSERYGSYGNVDQVNNKYNYGGSYGNNENTYEYNTSMEGYKSSQQEGEVEEDDFMP